MSGPVAWLYTLEYGKTVADKKLSLYQLNYPFGVCGADYLRSNDDGMSYVRQTPLYAAPAPVAQRNDGMPASVNERLLRHLLAARVGIPGAYFDDGEAQGQQYGISFDFMRDPVADIEAKLRALAVARRRAATAPVTPLHTTVHLPRK